MGERASEPVNEEMEGRKGEEEEPCERDEERKREER